MPAFESALMCPTYLRLPRARSGRATGLGALIGRAGLGPAPSGNSLALFVSEDGSGNRKRASSLAQSKMNSIGFNSHL
jgi:hypothetical protein